MTVPAEPDDGGEAPAAAGDADVAAAITSAIDAALAALRTADARTEALGEFVPSRRVLGITREARVLPRGRVWHLGVLLLGDDGSLHAAGTTTRSVDPRWRNYQSISGEQRRDLRAAAHRSKGIAEGEVVNLGTTRIETDAAALAEASASPVFLAPDGTVRVRWRPGDQAGIEFGAYLRERVELAVHPPGES